MRRPRARLAVTCLFVASLAVGPLMATPARSGVEPPRFAIHATGYSGGEPTLAVLSDGTILAQALAHTVRSTNGGKTWTDAHVPATGETTLDPYIHADAQTDRILASQLFGACQMLSHSDDGGATWLDHPTQCPSGDHQKIGSGPWSDQSTHLYPRAFYTCLNHVGDTACAVSPDGGITWGPLVVVFPGVDPTADQGVGTPGLCGGLEGDPVSGPDGTIYVPREYCGRPYVGVSTDDGLTYTTHYVSPGSQTRPVGYGANNPSVTVDRTGTVYYAFTGADWRHYVAYSKDQGATWSKPVAVFPSGGSTTFPSIVAGKTGAVATAFLGTPDSKKGPDGADKDARWYAYLAYSLNANSPKAEWKTMRLSNDIVMIGCIQRHGSNCGQEGHDGMLDFIDTSIGPDGLLSIVYTDACVEECDKFNESNSSIVTVATQYEGPRFK
jgi:hypothetical protein